MKPYTSSNFQASYDKVLGGNASTEEVATVFQQLQSQQAGLTPMLLTPVSPAAAALKLKLANQQKELEKTILEKYKNINLETDEAFQKPSILDSLKNTFADIKDSFLNLGNFDKDKFYAEYDPKYNIYDHSLGGNESDPTIQMASQAISDDDTLNNVVAGTALSPQEQQAYDNAVASGNVNVANHYAIVNNARLQRVNEAGGTSGLLEGDVVNLTTEGNNAAQDADNIEDL